MTDLQSEIDRLESELSELRRRQELSTSGGCVCRIPQRAWLADGTCGTCHRNVLEKQLTPLLHKILCGNTGLTLWRNAAGYDPVRKVRYGLAPGSGDFVGLWTPGDAQYIEVEFKTPMGRLSPEQIRRRDLIPRLGGVYAVVRSEQQAHELLAYLRGTTPRPAFVFAPPCPL